MSAVLADWLKLPLDSQALDSNPGRVIPNDSKNGTYYFLGLYWSRKSVDYSAFTLFCLV